MPGLPDTLWRIAVGGRDAYPAGARYAWDNRRRQPADTVVLQAVDAGRVLVRRCDGGEELAGPGSVFLVRYGEASWYGFPPGERPAYRTRWLALRGAGLPEHWDALRATAGWVLPLTPELDRRLEDALVLAEPAHRATPLAEAAAVHALVMELAGEARAAAHAAASPTDRAIAEIIAAPYAPLSIKRIAEAQGITREHLTRAFARRLGLPPAAWLARVRLERALLLLRETRQTVAAVARASGLGSAHTLARQVRAATGGPPGSLRPR
jgi:AraC-like DNA-binding protein